MTDARRTLAAWAVVAAGLLAAGCGGPVPLGQVSGTVVRGGKPLAGIEVTFCPEPSKERDDGRSSIGVTDADGRYVLTFADATRPGAVLGPHKVLLRDVAWENGRDDPARGQPRVSGDYLLIGKTPLAATVTAGAQTFDIEVK